MVWIASCTTPQCVVVMVSAPDGSVTTAKSVRMPRSIRAAVPTPPWSSPTTQATTTSPRRRAPVRARVVAALTMAVTPPFMLKIP